MDTGRTVAVKAQLFRHTVGLFNPRDTVEIYEMATKYHCTGVQFWLGMFDEELIEKMHAAGIRCNLYYADTPEDYDKYFSMGIDTLLTNRMDLANKWRK